MEKHRNGGSRRKRLGIAGLIVATVAATAVVTATAQSTGSGDGSVFVPAVPCRLADTRPAPNRIGEVATLTASSISTFQAEGDNGQCVDIPTEAVAVSLNITALNATAGSFLTVWGDGDKPLVASLNPSPGQPPVPNAVITPLNAAGAFNVFNNAGNVDMVVDINGYFVPSGGGPAGPTGPAGPAGPAGEDATTPDNVIDVALSGGDFTLLSDALDAIGTTLPAATAAKPYLVRIAPGTYTETSPISLRANVEIRGAGSRTTVIRCECGGTIDPTTGLGSEVAHASDSFQVFLYDVALQNDAGGDDFGAALRLENGASSTLRDVRLGALAERAYGLVLDDASAFIDNSVLLAQGSTAYGGHSQGGSVVVLDSRVFGDALTGDGVGYGWYADGSRTYMTESRIEAYTTGDAFGLFLDQVDPDSEFSNLFIEAESSTEDAIGLYNNDSEVRITGSSITATGDLNANAVVNITGSELTLDDVVATADSSGFGEGLTSALSSSATIRGSTIAGSTSGMGTIGSGETITVSSSTIEQGVDGSVFSCAFTVDENNDALSPTCT